MSALLRLYPSAWRERYGEEIEALIEEHPASLLDQLDLIRGAFDARLHPQVPGADVLPEQETPVNQRTLGVVAAIGGIAWILAVASLFVLPRDPNGDSDATLALVGIAIAIALTGVALGELGTRRGSATSAMTGHGLAAGSVGMAVLLFLPWPILAVGYLGFMTVSIVASLRGAMNQRFPGWFTAVFAGAAFAAVFASLGVAPEHSLTLLPMGLSAIILAWLAFTGRADAADLSPA
jgi:hypothetical protein